MAGISRRLLAKRAARLLAGRPEDRTRIARALAAHLVAHGQTRQAGALLDDIKRALLAAEGVLYADVESAFGLTAGTRTALTKYLQAATGAKKVVLNESADRGLLSGVIVRAAGRELDMTARRQLTQLASLTTGGK